MVDAEWTGCEVGIRLSYKKKQRANSAAFTSPFRYYAGYNYLSTSIRP